MARPARAARARHADGSPREGRRMRTAAVATLLALGLATTSCGGSGGDDGTPPPGTSSSASPSSSPVDRAAAESEIRRTWVAFFARTTPPARKLEYLENGASMRAAVQRFGTDPRAKLASAKVTGVVVTGPTSANVTYQVLLGS